jgi:hypothetical protein
MLPNEAFQKSGWIAENVPHPSPDHWRLYHLTTAEFGIIDVALGRLKVARLADLNDPFELKAKFVKRHEKIINEFWAACDRQIGLLCFSAAWQSPALWGHYGDKHRGMCLGFDIPKKIAEQVCYADKRIVVPLDRLGDGQDLLRDQDLMTKLRRTKYKDWNYEDEWTVSVSLNETLEEKGRHFYLFGDNLQLFEVILGPLCSLSLEDVQRLTRMHHPHAVTFKARTARQHYSIVPELS